MDEAAGRSTKRLPGGRREPLLQRVAIASSQCVDSVNRSSARPRPGSPGGPPRPGTATPPRWGCEPASRRDGPRQGACPICGGGGRLSLPESHVPLRPPPPFLSLCQRRRPVVPVGDQAGGGSGGRSGTTRRGASRRRRGGRGGRAGARPGPAERPAAARRGRGPSPTLAGAASARCPRVREAAAPRDRSPARAPMTSVAAIVRRAGRRDQDVRRDRGGDGNGLGLRAWPRAPPGEAGQRRRGRGPRRPSEPALAERDDVVPCARLGGGRAPLAVGGRRPRASRRTARRTSRRRAAPPRRGRRRSGAASGRWAASVSHASA